MTFIISLFYDPSRVKRAQWRRGPPWWAWFKDTYLYDYGCVYVYGWLSRRFWIVGAKIRDPNVRICPEHAIDKGFWPLMASPQYQVFSVVFFIMSFSMFIKNMRR